MHSLRLIESIFTLAALDSWQLVQRGRSAGSTLDKVTLSSKALWIIRNNQIHCLADSDDDFVSKNIDAIDLSANEDNGFWSIDGDG